jgi:L-arabinose transport system substrate-binding protein
MSFKKGALAVSLLLAFVAAACGGNSTPAGGGSTTLKIAYLTKHLASEPFFGVQSKALVAEGPKYNSVVTPTDLGDKGDAAISIFKTVLAQHPSGVIMTVPDHAIGPEVIQLAAAAKVPMVTLYDQISDSSGKQAPFVGLDDTAFGQASGKQAVTQFGSLGWSSRDSSKTGVALIALDSIPACKMRVDGSSSAFQAGVSSVPANNYFRIPYDGSTNDAITSMTAAHTAHPQITSWIVFSCNDDGVFGSVRALQNAGVSADNIIGVGQSGNDACAAWSQPSTGYRGSTFIDATQAADLALGELQAKITKGTALPDNNGIKPVDVTKDNYKQYFTCT